MKRLFDFLASLGGLLVLLPVFILVSVLIMIIMPGPVLFRQKRVGKNGKLFYLYKFRTMSILRGTEGGSFHAGDSSRITPLGKILRKTKIDELPQLVNVLKGEMSIVGPRPEVEQWIKVYPEKWKIVHQVKPGISDNASIVFRNEEEILAASDNPTETYQNEILPRKLDLYISYVQDNSILGDLLIIFKTIKTVLIH